jgi:peroxiredoxin
MKQDQPSKWLIAAGIYNIAWGTWVVLFPSSAFSLLSMRTPDYLFLWQCIGMIVGVYGLGYLIAAHNSRRHWPIVLVGLLGKIFGPLGYLWGLILGTTPSQFGWLLITNDLIWLYPFSALLRDAYIANQPALGESLSWDDALDLRLGGELSLRELSRESDALVVFLRHAGCTFCRETLSDLAQQRHRIATSGVQIVLVTQGKREAIESLCKRYNLNEVTILSDPSRSLYRAFNLKRGSWGQLFGVSVWIRGLAALLRGHGIGLLDGDGFQMPGAFLLRKGVLQRAFRHTSASDRPDYCELLKGEEQ